MVGGGTITTTIDLPTDPRRTFDLVVGGLGDALARQGSVLTAGPGGRIVQEGIVVGSVTAWEPPRQIAFDWRPASWKDGDRATLEIRFAEIPTGTRVTLEAQGWGGVFSDNMDDLAGWFGSAVLAPLAHALSPRGLGDWLTDRNVRRPTGPKAREIYGNPIFHIPNFLLILDRLQLTPDDNLLEVGCGGGAFLHRALESGCRATAVDHSPEMVRLATEQNREAVDRGRLRILESEAYPLPVPDDTFSCSVMTGVVGFLPDPVAALREIRRALRPGGRLAVFGATAAMRGTPAAPEPYASRIRFFDVAEFEQLGRSAGFGEVRVEEPDLEDYARAAHVPDEALPLFRGRGVSLLLLARKV